LAVVAEAALRLFNPLDIDARMYVFHPARKETLAPNFRGTFKGIPVWTSEFGHRVPTTWDKRYGMEKPPGVTRVLVYGDSFAFGDEWPAEDSFVEQLQQRLDPRFTSLQVLNFGVPGYNPSQMANYVQETALRFHPDAVVLQFADPNDLVPSSPARTSGLLQGVKAWFRRHWHLYAVVWDVWYHGRDSELAKALRRWWSGVPQATLAAVSSTPPPEAVVREQLLTSATQYYHLRQTEVEQDGRGWQQAWTSYREMAVFLTTHDIPFAVLVATPAWDESCGAWACQGVTIRYGEIVDVGRPFYQHLAQHLGTLTPYYVSLDQVFGPYRLTELCDGRGYHYGPTKNAIIASALADELHRMGIHP